MIAGEGYRRSTVRPRGDLARVARAGAPVLIPVAIPPHPLPTPTSLPAGPPAQRGGTRNPAWLRFTDAAQRSLRQPLPVLVDLTLAAGVTSVLTGSFSAAVMAAAAFLAIGLLIGVWKRRSCVQAQGVGWYVRRVAPTAALAGPAAGILSGAGFESGAQASLGMLAGLTGLKLLLWAVVGGARRRGLGLRRTLVIGPERQVAATEYRIHLYPEAGLVCSHSHVCSPGRDSDPAASVALIEQLLGDHAIDHVVCTGGDSGSDSFMRDVVRLTPAAVDVTVVEQVPLGGGPLTRIGDLAVLCLGRPSWGSEVFKRVFDMTAAAALLALLSPVMLLTALAIRLGDPGPAIFRQRRTGRRNGMFTIYKFRSMVRDADNMKLDLMHCNVADGLLFKALNDPRITRVGRFIRRFSIDELPQLVNVLKGDMSLVGPRPLPSVFDPSDLFARVRHQALPGITGLWQVKGANALSYDDMIDLDCAYVATRSLGFDLKILLQTLPAVLVRRDPY